jgi:hypothetical protein
MTVSTMPNPIPIMNQKNLVFRLVSEAARRTATKST